MSKTSDLHYEMVSKRTRPPRLAIVTNIHDPDWSHTVVRIIEFLGFCWGGKHSLIIPTDGASIAPVFWTILERFGPDYVYVYRKSWGNVKIFAPDRYARELEARLEAWTKEFSLTDFARNKIEADMRDEEFDTFTLGADLSREIADRLVPFHYEKQFDWLMGREVPNELTAIWDVLPFVDSPKSILCFDGPSEISDAWWAAQTGHCAPKLEQHLAPLKVGTVPSRVDAAEARRFVRWLTSTALDSKSSNADEILFGEAKFPLPDAAMVTPFDLSMVAVQTYIRRNESIGVGKRSTIVYGDSIEDFCLSYCLPRIGQPTAWLPASWVGALKEQGDGVLRQCVHAFLGAAPTDVRMQDRLNLCSVSESMSKVAELPGIFQERAGFGVHGGGPTPLEPMEILYQRVPLPVPYCTDSPYQSELVPFIGRESAGPIDTPRPSGFSKLSATKHRWIAEILAGDRSVPTIPDVIQSLIASALSEQDARSSHQAVAYRCPGSLFTFGDDINSNLANPSVRLFDTFSAVSTMARIKGYHCRISDKGIYMRDSIEKLGGLADASKFLSSEEARALFRKFVDHEKRAKGKFDEGCVVDGRTYLDLAAVSVLLDGDEDAAVDLLDGLVAKGVLARGFVLGCTECKNVEWYPLGDISDEFQCARCKRRQVISRRNWKHPASPQVFYGLDEIFYHFIRNNGDISVLALGHLERKWRHRFNYCPEIELSIEKKSIAEVDICAAYDGILAIGEAKKVGNLDSSEAGPHAEAAKYAQLAEMFHSRRVLFCTTDSHWSENVRQIVSETFKGSLAIPIFLTGEDLLNS
jgi:hypothetical protein